MFKVLIEKATSTFFENCNSKSPKKNFVVAKAILDDVFCVKTLLSFRHFI